MVSSAEHFLKALCWMLVMPSCRLTVVRLEHPVKRLSSISLTLVGMVISVRLVQSSKALLPMTVMVDGMFTLTSDAHFLKAALSISST